MKLIICATWVGCPKNHGDTHLAEMVVAQGTAEQMRELMNKPVPLWKEREFTCKHCGEKRTLMPSGNYLID